MKTIIRAIIAVLACLAWACFYFPFCLIKWLICRHIAARERNTAFAMLCGALMALPAAAQVASVSQVPNAITNAWPAIETIATNPPASFADHLGADVGIFVNTRAAQFKNTLIAGMVTYSTGTNTFLGVGAFAGERFKGGAEAVGGLKSEGSLHIPLINYTLHTSQWVADGLCYVSGISGTQAYGVTIQARHGWENYFVATVVAHVTTKFSVGISTLSVGPDTYLGGGVGYRF